MAVRIQIRRDTAANWVSASTVLADGEIGFETDTGKIKIGNGSSPWSSLTYFVGNLPGATLDALGDVTITSIADGDFLRWSGSASAWVNDPVNLSTDTVGDYVESLVAGTGVTLSDNSGEAATPTIEIGQDVATTASVTFAHVSADLTGDVTGNVTGNVTGDLTGNADTATALETARTISLAGDLSGSVSFDGTSNVTITAEVQPNSVALGTDTTGNFMSDVVGGTGVSVSHTPGESSSASIAIGQDVATTASVTFAHVAADVTGNVVGDLTGNADTATALETGRSISLAGDLSGSVSFDGTTDVTITAEVQPNSIALGTDTTGNYMSDVTGGTGVSVTHTPGEGSSAQISIGQDVGTSASVTFSKVTADLVGDVTGNADTASTLQTARLISVNGDLSGSVIFDGSSDVTLTAQIQANSVALGVDTTGNYVSDVAGGTGVSIAHTPGEGSTPTISIGQDVGTTASVTFANVTVSGDLTVNGTTTTLNTEELLVEDNIILLNSNVTGTPTAEAGIEVERGTSPNVQLRWNENTDSWELTEDGTTFKNISVGQDVETTSSVIFAHVSADVTGDLTGNADTASTLQTARTIELSGDVTGSVSFDGSGNVNIVTSVEPDSVVLGTDTTGNYMVDAVAGTGVTITHTPGEGSTASVAIGQDVATTASVTFSHVSADFTGALTGNADTATTLETARTINLAGDLSGSVSFDGSSDVTITAEVQPNSIALGTDTTGNFVSDVVGGTGVSVTHTPGESSSASIAIGQDVATTASVTFAHVSADLTGNVTGDLAGNADTATALETARTFSLTGDLSGSVTFDGTSDVTITAEIQPDSIALGIDTTGNFVSDVVGGTGVSVTHTPGESSSASIAIGQDVATTASVTFAHVAADVTGNLTGDVTGNADTATTLETARTISLAGDLSGSVSFDGSQNVTITAEVQPNSVALGTDTTGNFVADLVAGTGISITHTPGEASTASVTLNAWLNDLGDVVVGVPEEFQTLGYDGAGWVPQYAPVVSYVRNAESTTLTTGTVVYLFGGTGDHASVKRADNNSDTTSSKTVGIVAAPIAANQNGPVITRGYVDGMNLSAYSPGDILWLNTNGGFTTTKPTAPKHMVFIGVVVRATNNGIMYVAVQNGYELGELHDVKINGVSDGQFLRYNSSSAVWVNDTINLGTDTAGDYVQSLVAGTGVTLSNNSGEGSTPTVAIGQDVSTSASVVFYNLETTHDLTIGRNLYVSGSVITENQTSLEIDDPFIYLNGSSSVSNVDLGIAGNYNDGTYAHAGIFRDATDGKWKFFDSYTPEPSSPIDTDHASYSPAPVVAERFESTVTTGTAPFSVASTTEVANLHADTASSLHTARAISLAGDLSGSVSFDGSGDVVLTASVEPNSVALGTDTTGNYMVGVAEGTGVTIIHTPGEGSTASISIGQAVGTSSSVTFAHVTADLSGNVTGNVVGNLTGDVTGNADTATALETARAISLAGDLSGSVSFDGTQNVTITAEIQPNSVALGTDTTGNYVSDVTAGTGVTVTHTPGEGSSPTIAIGQAVGTSSSVTFAHVSAPVTGNVTGNLTGNVTGNASTATTLQNARTISLAGNVSGSTSFNGSTNVTITSALSASISELLDVSSATPAVGDALVWTGTEWAPDTAGPKQTNTTINTTSATTIASFNKNEAHSAEFTVQVSQGDGYLSNKVLVLHNGTNVTHTKYGQISFPKSGVTTGISSWTTRTSNLTGTISDIEYGNGIYVAAQYENGQIRTSTDAITWVTRTSNFPVASNSLHALKYGNGAWVAVGYGGAVRSSTDAITWTTRTSNVSELLAHVEYGNGRWVAVGYTGTMIVSTDAITWTTRNPYPETSPNIFRVAYGDGKWVAVAGFGGEVVKTSTDTVTWVTGSISGNIFSATGLQYAGGTWVMSGYYGSIHTSTDGSTWTQRTSNIAPFGTIRGLAYGDGLWAIIAGGGEARISTDAITWTTDASLPGSYARSLAYNNGQWVAGMDSNILTASSETSAGSDIPVTFTADISGSDVRLRATVSDANTTTATAKVLKTLVED